jgi:chemotaxis signal transduction protein/hemoglobin-like flavoprotein
MMVSDTLGVAGSSADTSSDERLLIEFELAGESYGVEISTVREIIRVQEITRVPGVPDVVEGIINLRGVVVPIVDLRKRLGVTVTEQGINSRVIVTEIDEALVGVLVDAVTGVIRLTSENLQTLSKHAQTADSHYLEGVAQFDERLVVLVNIVAALERESLHEVKWDGEVVSEVDEAVSAREGATAEEGLPLQIELLESSFEALKPRGDELVELFYDSLFEQYPGVLPLFSDADMQEQQGKLLSALALVVANLRTPDVLVPALQELGRKHVGYGAEPAHYDAVGQVLLESMEAIAGDLWNDELLAAWAEAYGIVSSVMIEAASEVETPVQLHPEIEEPVEGIAEPVSEVEPEDEGPGEPIEFEEAKQVVEQKKPAAKKPAAKKPVAKKAAAKKPVAQKSSSRSKKAS